MKHLRLESQVACEFSVAMEYAEEYVRERIPRVLRVPLRLGPLQVLLKRTMTIGVVVHPDWTDAARRHSAIELRMHPLNGPPFPDLHFLLTVRPHLPPGARIAVDITYRPPLASAGRFFDAIVGRHIAKAIARDFLEDLTRYLTARSRAFRSSNEAWVLERARIG